MGDTFLVLKVGLLWCICFEDTFVEAVVLWERVGEGDTFGESNFESQVLGFMEKPVDLCELVLRD